MKHVVMQELKKDILIQNMLLVIQWNVLSVEELFLGKSGEKTKWDGNVWLL